MSKPDKSTLIQDYSTGCGRKAIVSIDNTRKHFWKWQVNEKNVKRMKKTGGEDHGGWPQIDREKAK